MLFEDRIILFIINWKRHSNHTLLIINENDNYINYY